MPMELAELRLALSQVLENYQRCGVERLFPKPEVELPAEVLGQLQSMSLPDSSSSVASRAVAGAPALPPAAVATAPTPVAASAAAMPAVPSVTVPSPVAPGTWQLPVLTADQRQSEFDSLRQQVVACTRCSDIVGFRQQTVFGAGPLQPRICFLGEAPGADEDRTGQPFVGKAGQLLTKIIAAMQLKREEVYILNALKCRPPQNRTPVPDEISNCRPFVTAQLEVLKPEFIVCLGAVAAQSLLNSTDPIGRMRGRFHQYRGARVVVTYHPSYLLRNENAKRLVWEDMKMLMAEL